MSAAATLAGMSRLQTVLALLAGLASALVLTPALLSGDAPLFLLLFALVGMLTLLRFAVAWPFWVDGPVSLLGAVALLATLPVYASEPLFFWLAMLACWSFAWLFVERLSQAIRTRRVSSQFLGLLIPIVFGLSLLLIWEVVTRGANVPQVLLPPPSQIWARLTDSVPTLVADFQQTFLKAVLAGYAMGCGAGFVVAILVDRSPFLKAGLLPIGNFVSALPIIGIAPIMVMWFGFDWPSKAAVVVAMTFFPMLVALVRAMRPPTPISRPCWPPWAPASRIFSYWPACRRPCPTSSPACVSRLPMPSLARSLPSTPARPEGWASTFSIPRTTSAPIWCWPRCWSARALPCCCSP